MESSLGAQPTSHTRSAPSFSFSGRTKVWQDTAPKPGPGAYGGDRFGSGMGKQVVSTARSSSHVPFTSAPQRVDMARLYRDNPGPGQYTPKPAIGTGFRATLRSRVTVRSLHKTPSSADYEVGAPLGKQVRGDLRSAPAFSLGSRPKKGGLPIGSDAPGPGTYAVNAKTRSGKHPLSTVKSQPAFSMASRPPVVKHEWDSQGPGQSRTDSGFGKQVHGMQRSNPAFSMGSRTTGGNVSMYTYNDNPGPGAFDPLRSLAATTSSPSATLRSRVKQPAPYVTPSPADYMDDNATGKQVPSTRRTAPKFSFGTDVGRKKGVAKVDGVPGPGTYREVGTLGGPEAKRKGASMRGREKFGSLVSFDPSIPGPGQYDDQSMTQRRRAPGQKMASAKRKTNLDKDGPGPGAYSPKVQRHTPEFTLAGRVMREYKSFDTVGPGVCREDTAFGNKGRGVTFGTRTKIWKDDPSPGPGAYGRFSRGVRSVPHRKLNLTGKKKRKKRRPHTSTGTRPRRKPGAARKPGAEGGTPKRVAAYV